jgi:soluble lytic murein transglycosylase-like protein
LKHGSTIAAALVAAAFSPGAAAQAEGQTAPADSVAHAVVPDAPTLGSGSYLARVLAQLRRGEPVLLDIPIEVSAPGPLPAASFARIYGTSPELARLIIDSAIAEGINPDLAFRLVRVESVFRPRARGPRGALGLTQLMPSTARAIDRTVRTEAQILEPETNLRLGFRHLRRMIDRYDGDVRLGLLAYNRGEGTVDRALRSGRDPENGYSRKVLGTHGHRPYRGSGTGARRLR